MNRKFKSKRTWLNKDSATSAFVVNYVDCSHDDFQKDSFHYHENEIKIGDCSRSITLEFTLWNSCINTDIERKNLTKKIKTVKSDYQNNLKKIQKLKAALNYAEEVLNNDYEKFNDFVRKFR